MPVTIYVSKGSFGTPPYKFYSDNNGYQELNNLALDPSKSYLFKRLNSASVILFILVILVGIKLLRIKFL